MLRTLVVAPVTRTVGKIPSEFPLGTAEGLPAPLLYLSASFEVNRDEF